MSADDEDPICEWCHHPWSRGAARLRFLALVYHLACWDARVAAAMPEPRPQPAPEWVRATRRAGWWG